MYNRTKRRKSHRSISYSIRSRRRGALHGCQNGGNNFDFRNLDLFVPLETALRLGCYYFSITSTVLVTTLLGTIKMPEYAYKCLACDYKFSDIVPMKKYKKRRKCPECKKYKLERILGSVSGFSKGEATTLGQLAEQNVKKRGTVDKKVDKKEKIWYHKSGDASSTDINKMTDDQKHRYVRTGKKR